MKNTSCNFGGHVGGYSFPLKKRHFFLQNLQKKKNSHFFLTNLQAAEKRKHRKNPRNFRGGKKCKKSVPKFPGNLQICKIRGFPYENSIKFIKFISRYRAETAFLPEIFSGGKLGENLCKFCHFFAKFWWISLFCKNFGKKVSKICPKIIEKDTISKKCTHVSGRETEKKALFLQFFSPRKKSARANFRNSRNLTFFTKIWTNFINFISRYSR